MTKIIHPVAGAITLLTIATFWLSTVLSELFGSEALIVSVKTAIPWGFLLLIPARMEAPSVPGCSEVRGAFGCISERKIVGKFGRFRGLFGGSE